MNISSVQVIYFSPTGGTKKLALKLASSIADKLNVPLNEVRLTLPEARKRDYDFSSEDLVILACPTFARRVPNKIAPDLQRILHFDGSPAVALSSYGNRSYGTAPQELISILNGAGAVPFAAGAFVCRHSFDVTIAKGRPDRQDRAELESFADKIAGIVSEAEGASDLKRLEGEAGEYYRPLKEDGTPAVFLKAKPLTHMENCYKCGLCVKVCPMGSIEPDFVTVSGICIKCQACVHSCPEKAKYFDDPDFLSHVRMLRREYGAERAGNKIFL